MVPTGTGKTGKPGEMGRHFPVTQGKVWEFCSDWKSRGKVREFYPKYWKKSEKIILKNWKK